MLIEGAHVCQHDYTAIGVAGDKYTKDQAVYHGPPFTLDFWFLKYVAETKNGRNDLKIQKNESNLKNFHKKSIDLKKRT